MPSAYLCIYIGLNDEMCTYNNLECLISGVATVTRVFSRFVPFRGNHNVNSYRDLNLIDTKLVQKYDDINDLRVSN